MLLTLPHISVFRVGDETRDFQVTPGAVFVDLTCQEASSSLNSIIVRLPYLMEAIPNLGPPVLHIDEIRISILLLPFPELVNPLFLFPVFVFQLLLIGFELLEELSVFSQAGVLDGCVLGGPLDQLVPLVLLLLLEHLLMLLKLLMNFLLQI